MIIEPESLLESIAGTDTLQVNSRHHQAVDKLGRGLAVVARAEQDGTAEAIEDKSRRFVLGVQWHPEDQITQFPEQLQLFRRLAEAL